MKSRKKLIFIPVLFAVLLLALVFGVFGMNAKEASAATSTTAKYLTQGRTTNETSVTTGCPENFKIYMYGQYQSGGSGTLTMDSTLDWSYVTITVEASMVSDHMTFQLLRNGKAYSSKSLSGNGSLTLFSSSLADGEYELQYSCRYAPNFLVDFTYFFYTFTFTIDKSAPQYTLYAGGGSIASGGYTNKQIEYTAIDENFDRIWYKKPGASSYSSYFGTSYAVQATDANNGRWYFYATDDFGANNATVNVYLDTVKPVGKVTNASGSAVSDGGYTNSAIRYTATDTGGVSKYEIKRAGSSGWTSYTAGTSVTGINGCYSFRATDVAGNVSKEYKVYLDTGLPTGALYAGTSSAASGSYTNADHVRYVANDSGSGVANCFVKMPGSGSYTSYLSGTQLTKEGEYAFYSMDRGGNRSATVTITLDCSKPAGSLYGGTEEKENGSYTNADYIMYSASDALSGVAKYYVKKPGTSVFESYTSNAQLTADGKYEFYCTDRAGNQSDTVSITLDRKLPIGVLYAGKDAVTDGAYTKAAHVSYTASDELSGIAKCYVRMPGSNSFAEFAGGTRLATEGEYFFYAVDRAGNQSRTLSVTLDKTEPEGILYSGESEIASDGSTNADYIKFVPNDDVGISATYVKKPGMAGYTNYISGTHLTEAGTYVFYTIDKAGNASVKYTVRIDREIPAAQLYADDVPVSDNGYTNAAHIRFECTEQCFVKVPGSEEFTAYLSGAEYYKPGKYVFYGISEAGNSTGLYTIVIDRTQKVPELLNVADGRTDGDVTLTWTDGDPELYAPIASVIVNGKPYTKGATIYTIDTGVYRIACKDAAGNVWETQFTSCKRNVLTQTLQKEYWEASNAEGEFFAFASYDAAFAFAAERESRFVRTGEWNSESWDAGIAMDAKDSVNAVQGTYFIYKKSGNPGEEVAYFTQERLNEVIAEYAAEGIASYYYWEKTPAAIFDGENLYSYSDGKTILADAVMIGENVICHLNGEPFDGTLVEQEGENVLIVADAWGNECEYRLVIVRTSPEIMYATESGNANSVTFDRTYYFKDAVTVSIADAYDEMAMFNVYDEEGTLIGSFSLDETYTITDSGSYTVEAVNHAGKSQLFSLIISRNAPSVAMTENAQDKTLDIVIAGSPDKESHIQTIEIYKSVNGGETWDLLTADDYGTPIAIETLAYRFRTSGEYRVVVTDEFRTGIDAVVHSCGYEQSVPDGFLNGVENGGYTNGTVTFEWTDEASVVVTKDGTKIDYTSGKKLSEDGRYEIVFENFDGYRATYSFVIDTAAPEVKLEGATNGAKVNHDVKAFYEEEGLTAELFKDGKALGAYASGTVLTESGAYRLVVSDLARNRTELTFTIDKFVDFAIDVNDKGLVNSVTVTAGEEAALTLTKDGEQVEYALGDTITEPAAYSLVITDALGNRSELSFTIVRSLVQKFEHNFDEMSGFEKVLVNREEYRLNYGTLELTADGTYEIDVVVNGKAYAFTVTVDGTAPTLSLTGVENGGTTAGGVTLSEPSETAEVKVYCGEEEIAYKFGETIFEEGEYRVTVTDVCGNSTEYTFTIAAGTNWGLVALGIVLGLLVVGGVVFFLLKRRNSSQEEDE